jgi:methionyl aminopeptidase
MNKYSLKTPEELNLMKEGGKKLSLIKKELIKATKAGVSAATIDTLAEKLILESGGKPSFKMVKDYSWSTCINVNEGVVHGVPHKGLIFKEGDLISIDLGMLYKGFHTDTSLSFDLNGSKEVKSFLNAGREAFDNAIATIEPDNSYVFDISKAIEDTVRKYGYRPILDLTGHGIGRNLHENPYIPCFAEGLRIESPKIVPGMAIAIEVMYAKGSPSLVKENDGWTIATQDGKIAGFFEETVIVFKEGYEIIT